MQSTRSLTSPGEDHGMTHAPSGGADTAHPIALDLSVVDDALNEAWFDRSPVAGAALASNARPSTLPPAQVVGDFLGDELADAWLR